ncbi:hypothetical protein HJC23_013160 [Cyclotella cryptica]|uniref:PAS domain-containing protein n=1 Tax=Cyclotella cryptica TaxID=29204 RepID=A0ABD3QMU3_9STRA
MKRNNTHVNAFESETTINWYFFGVDGGNDKKHGFVPYANEDLALIEVRKARKAREDMHHKFWTAHQSRKDIAAQRPFNDEKTSLYSKTNREHKISFYAVHPDKHRNRAPLPSKLEDIYLDFIGFNNNSFDLPIRRQAIAITEATPPFKIIDVNKAWIDLCGYSRKQAIGSTLKILQGPETNLHAASKLVSTLLAKAVPGDNKNEECETVLTNYRSDGKKFRNHIRVGLLKDDVGKVINFVGVFKRLDDDDDLIV